MCCVLQFDDMHYSRWIDQQSAGVLKEEQSARCNIDCLCISSLLGPVPDVLPYASIRDFVLCRVWNYECFSMLQVAYLGLDAA